MKTLYTPMLNMRLIAISGRFVPFSNYSIEIDGQTIESSEDEIVFYGVHEFSIKKDRTGLAQISMLLGRDYGDFVDLIIPIIRKIEFALLCVNNLPDELEVRPPTTSPNPFA